MVDEAETNAEVISIATIKAKLIVYTRLGPENMEAKIKLGGSSNGLAIS